MSDAPNPRTDAAAEAFQDRWNDWCFDTGDHPDFVFIQRHEDGFAMLGLDTRKLPFDDFMASALAAADAVSAPLLERVTQSLRAGIARLIERHVLLLADAKKSASKSRAHNLRTKAAGISEAIALLGAVLAEVDAVREPQEDARCAADLHRAQANPGAWFG